jgi:isoleucyl-tRNA synthetase
VHTETYPKYNEQKLDENLNDSMNTVREICTLGRAIREKEKIKVRQPIAKIIIPSGVKEKVKGFEDLILDELNIKEIVFAEDKSEYMDFELLVNFQIAGKTLGKKMQSFKKELENADAPTLLAKLDAGEKVSLEIDGEETAIERDFVDTKISSKEGFSAELEGDLFAILETTITPALKEEGLVREFISKVQQIRKAIDLDMMDNIEIRFAADDELTAAIKANETIIKKETLAKAISTLAGVGEPYNINGIKTNIEVTKI